MSEFSKPGAGWAKGTTSGATFQLGKGKTLAIPMETHAAARKKLIDGFAAKGITEGIVLLKGGEQTYQYDSDTELVFRQDSWFQYLFGVKEPGLYGAVSLTTGKSTIFIPKLPDEYRVWCGVIHPPSHFQASYAVDEVLYVHDLEKWISGELPADSSPAAMRKLHLMKGVNTDSGAEAEPARFEGDATFWSAEKVSLTDLYPILSVCRVTKSPLEMIAMRYSSYVASNAHVEVMRGVARSSALKREGTVPAASKNNVPSYDFEYELEAKFMYEIYKNGGCRRAAYTAICACGPNNAVLHYGHAAAPNDRELQMTDMALLDMGAEYHGYVSDITCSFPISGSFTADQRGVFEGVLNAQRVVLAHMKPGALWTDCHKLAEREVLAALQRLGVLVTDCSIDELVAAEMGPVFMPHGLGHLIGCDTHDVGGYMPDGSTPSRHTTPGLNKLRTARVLEVDMVLTNEPGCYFIDALLDAALADKGGKARYINDSILQRFRQSGGVRLEDVVVVTETGVRNLTTCPRTVQEVESVMAGGVWPPAVDEAPYLFRQWGRLAEDCSCVEDIAVPAAAVAFETTRQ